MSRIEKYIELLCSKRERDWGRKRVGREMYEEKCQEVESFDVEYVALLRTKDKGLEIPAG